MDRKKIGARGRLVSLRSVGGKSSNDKTEGPAQDVVAVSLGYRMVHSEQSEIWTITGILRSGEPTRQDVGELSFILIPGDMEPATAVTGFISPTPPYFLGMNEDALWQQIRAMVVQLGYDIDGFYASIAVGGQHRYYEDYKR